MSENAGPPQTEARIQPSADHYEVVQVIGKGSFGTVSKIRRKIDGRIMVWKELNYGIMKEKEKELVVSEVNILRGLKHPFIVRYYDRIIDKASTKLYIVMEYCEGGDLGMIIKRAKANGCFLDEEFIWKIFSQCIVALKECHRHKEPSGKLKPILHRDLKPSNILLDANQNIKIGDFGLAKELASESKFAYTNVGTPFYMSPEMISESKYNEKSDIWALGCLLYELSALAPPFDATNHISLAVKITAGRFPRIPSQYSEDLYRAIRWMLQVDSRSRPSVEDLEKLPKIKAGIERCAHLFRGAEGAHTRVMTNTMPRSSDVCGSCAKSGDLEQRELRLQAAEKYLREKEAQLQAFEASLREKESALLAAEKTLTERESNLIAAEKYQRERETYLPNTLSRNTATTSTRPSTATTNALAPKTGNSMNMTLTAQGETSKQALQRNGSFRTSDALDSNMALDSDSNLQNHPQGMMPPAQTNVYPTAQVMEQMRNMLQRPIQRL